MGKARACCTHVHTQCCVHTSQTVKCNRTIEEIKSKYENPWSNFVDVTEYFEKERAHFAHKSRRKLFFSFRLCFVKPLPRFYRNKLFLRNETRVIRRMCVFKPFVEQHGRKMVQSEKCKTSGIQKKVQREKSGKTNAKGFVLFSVHFNSRSASDATRSHHIAHYSLTHSACHKCAHVHRRKRKKGGKKKSLLLLFLFSCLLIWLNMSPTLYGYLTVMKKRDCDFSCFRFSATMQVSLSSDLYRRQNLLLLLVHL